MKACLSRFFRADFSSRYLTFEDTNRSRAISPYAVSSSFSSEVGRRTRHEGVCYILARKILCRFTKVRKSNNVIMMKMLLVFSIVCATTLAQLEDSRLKAPCPRIKCLNECENGYLKNAKGCDTCACNPCRFGTPWDIPCGNGKNQCSAKGGTCKISDLDKPYCCPNERAGCCPSKNIFTRNPSVNAKTIPIVSRI